MAGGMNLATKYSKQVDERWERESQATLVTSHAFDFKGDQTVVVYSIPYAALNDYQRSGSNRYGTPNDLSRNVQTLTVTQDKGFTFVLDRGDEIQSEYVCNPGTALAREIREAIVPAFDTYCFKVMAASAIANGHTSTTAVTTANAHKCLLDGIQHMADRNVPVEDCYAFCTYSYANLLMQDSAFIRYGDAAQRMLKTGVIGIADGVEIVLVAGSRLPAGTSFLLVHKDACVAPKQLEEYKTHVNPLGYSGTVCEGRVLYDCFVLDEKSDGIYYHGGQAVLKDLRFMTSASGSGKSTIIMNCEKEQTANKWYMKTAATQAALPAVAYGTAIDVTTSSSPWFGATQLTAKETQIAVTSGHTRVRVVEVLSDMTPIAYADKKLNVG